MSTTAQIDERAPLLAEEPIESTHSPEQVQEEELERPTDDLYWTVAVGGLLAIVIVTWTITLTHNPSKMGLFAFHPPLQTLAVLLFGLGILTLQPTSKADMAGKKAGLTRHQIFNFVLGFPIILTGASLMYYYKASHGYPHFTSWHSKFGLICVTWIILQAAVGAGSAWFGGAAFGGGDRAKSIYKYHRVSGYLLLIMLLTTIYLAGTWSSWIVFNTNLPERIVGYSIAPMAVVGAVFARMRTSKMRFV